MHGRDVAHWLGVDPGQIEDGADLADTMIVRNDLIEAE
jgi:hypothetical protein